MRTNRPHIPLYGICCMESKHIYVYCILFVGSKERHTKTITILWGEGGGNKKQPLLGNTLPALTMYFQETLCNILSALSLCNTKPGSQDFFFLFSLGCALNPTSNNGPSSSWGKKKKKNRASSDCLCVVRVSGSFQKRQEYIVLSRARTPV